MVKNEHVCCHLQPLRLQPIYSRKKLHCAVTSCCPLNAHSVVVLGAFLTCVPCSTNSWLCAALHKSCALYVELALTAKPPSNVRTSKPRQCALSADVLQALTGHLSSTSKFQPNTREINRCFNLVLRTEQNDHFHGQ